MVRKNLRLRKNSGQMLVITALFVSLLLISTFYYIFEVGNDKTENEQVSLNNYVLMIKLGSTRTVLNSLANITNGGSIEVLNENLELWKETLKKEPIFGLCVLDTQTWDSSPYSSGFWINWDANGNGISSACVEFNLTIYGRELEAQFENVVNITTSITVDGTYSHNGGIEKHVELICEVFNEGNPALAENFNVYFNNGSSWVQVQNFDLTDYGNGTYRITFDANIATSNVQVSVGANDLRQVYVQANATCTQV